MLRSLAILPFVAACGSGGTAEVTGSVGGYSLSPSAYWY